MKNKASLIQPVPADSWLNPSQNGMIINNLELTNGTPPPKNKKKRGGNYQHQQTQHQQYGEQVANNQMQKPRWNMEMNVNSMPQSQSVHENLVYNNNVADNLWENNMPLPPLQFGSTYPVTPVPLPQTPPVGNLSDLAYPQFIPSVIPPSTPSANVPQFLPQQFLMYPVDATSIGYPAAIPPLASLRNIPQTPMFVSTPFNQYQ